MKRVLRNGIVLIASLPAILTMHLLMALVGRKRAVETVGPLVTRAAKASLKYWVPTIGDASRFGDFKERMKRNLRRWRPLYDIRVSVDTPDAFQVHVSNCPFCEVFSLTGLKELNRYLCRADLEVAAENEGKWIFERTRTIAAGDALCDHTYRRETRAAPLAARQR